MVNARSPFSNITGELPAPLAEKEKAKERRKNLNEALRLLDKYAKEAKTRGWTGPELVYRLSIVRLKEDLFGEKEE